MYFKPLGQYFKKTRHFFLHIREAKLRQVFVHEILAKYDSFINLNTDAEAMKFLDSGYYNSQLGDLMPLAMANVLQAHVILLNIS